MTQPNPFSFDSNPFADFLEQEPNFAFQASLERFNPTPNQREFLQNQRNNIFNQFEAKQGMLLQAGQPPNLRFNDFIQDFNFGQAFQGAPQSQRPGNTQQFAPITRFFSR